MSESMIFPPWKAGAAKTSSFTGPLKHAGIELSPNVLINTDVQKTTKNPPQWEYLHAHFVPANDEGDFAAPGIDKAGPAGVDCDVLSVSCTETY